MSETIRERFSRKLSSGRWVFCMTCAFVFAWLSCRGQIEAKDALTIIGMVVSFYFGQRSSETTNGGNGQ